jgi:histidine triad (HIT) family protein
MPDCIFCKIISRTIPAHILFEDDDVAIFLDAFPTTTGHSLVVPKQHYARFVSTPISVVQKLISTVYTYAPRIARALGADGFNLGLNNGSAAGQVVEHVHWHIIPRSFDDGLKAWSPKQGSDDLSAVAATLQEALTKKRVI